MGYSIKLDNGTTSRTIPSNVAILPSAKKTISTRGDVESADVTLKVSGDIVETSEAAIGAKFFDFLSDVTEKFDPVTVTIYQDATVLKVYSPSEGFVGPHVVSFESDKDTDPGTGYSKWSYVFVIEYKAQGSQQQGEEPVFGLTRSLAITKKNGKIVRKVWKVSAQGTSSSSALNAVKAAKPSEKYITEETEEFFDEQRATGIWIWEAEAKGIKRITCRVTFGGGVGFVTVPRPGPTGQPRRFALMNEPKRLEVETEIISYEAEIPPPSAHFTEGPELWRAPREERLQLGSAIHDSVRGEYKRTFHEVYYTTGVVPAPDHDNAHNLINAGRAPADGQVAN